MEEAERRLHVAQELAEGLADTAAQVRVLEALGDLYLLFAENQRAIEAYRQALEIVSGEGQVASESVLHLALRISEAGGAGGGGGGPGAIPVAPTPAELRLEKP